MWEKATPKRPNAAIIRLTLVVLYRMYNWSWVVSIFFPQKCRLSDRIFARLRSWYACTHSCQYSFSYVFRYLGAPHCCWWGSDLEKYRLRLPGRALIKCNWWPCLPLLEISTGESWSHRYMNIHFKDTSQARLMLALWYIPFSFCNWSATISPKSNLKFSLFVMLLLQIDLRADIFTLIHPSLGN